MQYLNNYLGLLVIIKISYFTDFEEVIIKISHMMVKKKISKKPLVKTLVKNPIGKFHTTTNDHYKKSDFVLVKSLVAFYGQVSKALRTISYWLVSLLVCFY